MSEERLEKIESKIMLLEESAHELSATLYQQQKKIDQLKALCDSLVTHVRELAQAIDEGASGNEPPPHY